MAYPRLVNQILKPIIRVLFLGYNEQQTEIITRLMERNCKVWHAQDQIDSIDGYDLVISFGYRHILSKEVIGSGNAPMVNLHSSYLPWNRGAHPNFWSFYDDTPSGVSIHLIDEGVDTGPILYQKYVDISGEDKTFSQTYKKLIFECEKLFFENLDEIIRSTYRATPQSGIGSFHRLADLPREFRGWEAKTHAEIRRLKELLSDG